MALKMAAGKNTLKELLVQGDITPPHSDAGSLSPHAPDTPPSPDSTYAVVKKFTGFLFCTIFCSSRMKKKTMR